MRRCWRDIWLFKLKSCCCINGAICLSKIWRGHNTAVGDSGPVGRLRVTDCSSTTQQLTPPLVPLLNLCHQLAEIRLWIWTAAACELFLQSTRNPEKNHYPCCISHHQQFTRNLATISNSSKINLNGRVAKALLLHARIAKVGLASSNSGEALVFGPASRQLSHHS